MPSEENSASKNWERYVGILVGQGRTIFGAAVLPIAPDQPTLRKCAHHAHEPDTPTLCRQHRLRWQGGLGSAV